MLMLNENNIIDNSKSDNSGAISRSRAAYQSSQKVLEKKRRYRCYGINDSSR